MKYFKKERVMKIFFSFLIFITLLCEVYALDGIKNINKEEFKKLISEDKKIILLDVRTKEEYDTGHFDNSLLIDINSPDFLKRIKTLDKNKTYIVYCRSGNRSMKAAELMKREGFKSLYNLSGGYFRQ